MQGDFRVIQPRWFVQRNPVYPRFNDPIQYTSVAGEEYKENVIHATFNSGSQFN